MKCWNVLSRETTRMVWIQVTYEALVVDIFVFLFLVLVTFWIVFLYFIKVLVDTCCNLFSLVNDQFLHLFLLSPVTVNRMSKDVFCWFWVSWSQQCQYHRTTYFTSSACGVCLMSFLTTYSIPSWRLLCTFSCEASLRFVGLRCYPSGRVFVVVQMTHVGRCRLIRFADCRCCWS